LTLQHETGEQIANPYRTKSMRIMSKARMLQTFL
jgi:hypothetical protein